MVSAPWRPARGAAIRVHLSTDDLPLRDREPFWLDFVAKHVIRVSLKGRSDPTTFWAKLDAEVARRFTVFEFQTSHCGGGRTTADVTRDNSDRFYLRRVPREEIYATAPVLATAREIRLGPGDFCITSSEWPHKCEMKASTSISGLLIPHEVLSLLLAGASNPPHSAARRLAA
jgi:hypothetical protein